MNDKNLMYGVVNILVLPCCMDPEMISLEVFSSFDKALERSEEIIEEFIDKYGRDEIVHATEKKPVAVMYNGEVTAYAYIVKVDVK